MFHAFLSFGSALENPSIINEPASPTASPVQLKAFSESWQILDTQILRLELVVKNRLKFKSLEFYFSNVDTQYFHLFQFLDFFAGESGQSHWFRESHNVQLNWNFHRVSGTEEMDI